MPPRGEIDVDHLLERRPNTSNDVQLRLRATDDNFKVRQDASGALVVSGRGQVRSYTPGSLGLTSFGKIFASAGAGNDSITFEESVTLDVEVSGGAGNDTLAYRGTGELSSEVTKAMTH